MAASRAPLITVSWSGSLAAGRRVKPVRDTLGGRPKRDLMLGMVHLTCRAWITSIAAARPDGWGALRGKSWADSAACSSATGEGRLGLSGLVGRA